MSKNSNIQRTETLRTYMAASKRKLSQDAAMFVDPTKRRATIKRETHELDFDISSPIGNNPIKSYVPYKKKRV